jgi:hypothetical protein
MLLHNSYKRNRESEKEHQPSNFMDLRNESGPEADIGSDCDYVDLCGDSEADARHVGSETNAGEKSGHISDSDSDSEVKMSKLTIKQPCTPFSLSHGRKMSPDIALFARFFAKSVRNGCSPSVFPFLSVRVPPGIFMFSYRL